MLYNCDDLTSCFRMKFSSLEQMPCHVHAGLAYRADRNSSSGDELKCPSSSTQAEGYPEDLSRRGIMAAFPILMLAASAAPSHAGVPTMPHCTRNYFTASTQSEACRYIWLTASRNQCCFVLYQVWAAHLQILCRLIRTMLTAFKCPFQTVSILS